MTLIEYTGGSTGSALAFVCAAKGYRFKVVSSDAFAVEKLKTMKAFGADLTIVPSEDGKSTLDLFTRMIEQASPVHRPHTRSPRPVAGRPLAGSPATPPPHAIATSQDSAVRPVGNHLATVWAR